jgi:predicted enzyme related to lactoylglutathione lyase
MGNPVVQWQIVSPDPQQTVRFYGQLFGWTTNQHNALGYVAVQTQAGKGIDGGIWPAPAHVAGFVQLFVEVPDVDTCVAAAIRLGATVVVPASPLPDGDTIAVLRDPSGISIGVCRPGPIRNVAPEGAA